MVNDNPYPAHPCCIYPLHQDDRLYAWKVEVRRGAKLLVRTFTFEEHGGEQPARLAAESYRNALVLKMPAPQTYASRQRLLPHNTSGHPGVIRIETHNIGYWRASTRIHGYNLSRSFSVERHGEEQAKRLALNERQRQLALCEEPYEEAMKILQQHFSQTNVRVRERRIQAAIGQARGRRDSADNPGRNEREAQLSISPEQASLSISRHFAARTR
ncbi:AP2 domain-containing protein [Pseudomonas vanderleydeniana]|uniref:AP2 domain-containing protein n=1 Tax=Pseudomonas vanderleydeniana TaxID=2745495 RepID=A0A9E6PJ41_9PSED|nr:AP2 domain-containing protein [Pseudomonas vanderleydeniana]QXI27408.1 AP2 domain-containing protein [Pseudomonas vanderleydeniana]